MSFGCFCTNNCQPCESIILIWTISVSVQVSPLQKKQNIDEPDPANYRPVSNLNTISKIIERLALSRLRAPNFNVMQSAYRPLHSTETANLHLMNNLFCAAGSKRSSVVVALDLTAAFDTISHSHLLARLSSEF